MSRFSGARQGRTKWCPTRAGAPDSAKASARREADMLVAAQKVKIRGSLREPPAPIQCPRHSKEPAVKKGPPPPGVSPKQMIDARIATLEDWRGETLAKVRALIHEADPDIVEEWKWG